MMSQGNLETKRSAPRLAAGSLRSSPHVVCFEGLLEGKDVRNLRGFEKLGDFLPVVRQKDLPQRAPSKKRRTVATKIDGPGENWA